MGKGKIAHYEQFLFFLSSVRMRSTKETPKNQLGLVWERLKHYGNESLYTWICYPQMKGDT